MFSVGIFLALSRAVFGTFALAALAEADFCCATLEAGVVGLQVKAEAIAAHTAAFQIGGVNEIVCQAEKIEKYVQWGSE